MREKMMFLANVPKKLELLYDRPLSGEKEFLDRGAPKKFYWTQYSFRDMEDGVEYVKFFDTASKVAKELSQYKRGDQLQITYKEALDRGTGKKINFYEILKTGESPQAQGHYEAPTSPSGMGEQPQSYQRPQSDVIDIDSLPF